MSVTEPDYYSKFNAFVDETIAEARRRGWVIENLNANAQGMTVKGAPWKVTSPDGVRWGWYWNEKFVAFAIAPELA